MCRVLYFCFCYYSPSISLPEYRNSSRLAVWTEEQKGAKRDVVDSIVVVSMI